MWRQPWLHLRRSKDRRELFNNGIIYLTIETMIDIREYNDRGGRSPFRQWYDGLNSDAARKVTTALYRVGLGNVSNAKSVGAGVYECKINFGPGYRVYFEKRASRQSSFLAVAQNNANRTTLSLHSNGGKTTSRERSSRKKQKGSEHGFDARF
jgi:putative addiction module killer protein